MQNVSIVLRSFLLISIAFLVSCGVNRPATESSSIVQNIQVNDSGTGQAINISLEQGKSHNHPSFAIWAEDMEENFIQTLFVTKAIGTGLFGHGSIDVEKWDNKPGFQKRPASLPYWINKRIPADGGPQLPDPEHPVPDAYSGATPAGDSKIAAKLDNSMKGKIRILMEVNQPWDWNEYWTNTKFDDPEYRTSCQPSLVYAVTVDLDKPGNELYLNPIGHGHYSGENGELFTDLSTLSTAKDIFSKITVKVKLNSNL